MTLSTFNPFTWDDSASRVNSNVLSLTIKNHEGQTLSVKDSNEYIEMKIPREGNFLPEGSGLYFTKPSSEGKMQYHVVSLQHADGNAVRFRVSIMTLKWTTDSGGENTRTSFFRGRVCSAYEQYLSESRKWRRKLDMCWLIRRDA